MISMTRCYGISPLEEPHEGGGHRRTIRREQGRDHGGVSAPQGSRGHIHREGGRPGHRTVHGRGNMAIFKTREEAEAFSREDPFLLEGVVKSFVIKEWVIHCCR